MKTTSYNLPPTAYYTDVAIRQVKEHGGKTTKTNIETNLVNCFIRPFKSPAGTPILFIRKINVNFWLCIDYQGLNNLTMKN